MVSQAPVALTPERDECFATTAFQLHIVASLLGEFRHVGIGTTLITRVIMTEITSGTLGQFQQTPNGVK